MKIRIAILLVLISALCATVYFLQGPIADNRTQHRFLKAARRGDVSALQKLRSAGAKLDEPASYERGAVHSAPAIFDAIFYEHANAVRWLLEQGADPNLLHATETPLDFVEICLKKKPHSAALAEIADVLKTRGAKRLSEFQSQAE